jgi:predicted alpha/beta hydrolase family esterase
MVKVVIIHGNGGTTSDHFWYSWLEKELVENGIEAYAPTMPDNIVAKASVWLPYMKNALKCDQNTIVVGHSSGAVAAMRFAEDNKLLGTVLVGACYTDLGYESERIAGYYAAPWQWKKIKENQQWIVQLSSLDDPYIPIKQAHHIQKNLDTEYFEYKDEGHFQGNTLPDLLSIIISKL